MSSGHQVPSVAHSSSSTRDSSSSSHPNFQYPSKSGVASSSGPSTAATPHQQKSASAAAPSVANSHSNRFPLNSQQTNNLVLDLYSVRSNSQPNYNNNLCNNCTLAIRNEGDVNETGSVDHSSIEESILETFHRIDAQHVSNSSEIGEEERKMSIIENPLSDEPSNADVKTIPYHKAAESSRIAEVGNLHGKPEAVSAPLHASLIHQNPYVQIGAEMILLNNRVDELTKWVLKSKYLRPSTRQAFALTIGSAFQAIAIFRAFGREWHTTHSKSAAATVQRAKESAVQRFQRRRRTGLFRLRGERRTREPKCTDCTKKS